MSKLEQNDSFLEAISFLANFGVIDIFNIVRLPEEWNLHFIFHHMNIAFFMIMVYIIDVQKLQFSIMMPKILPNFLKGDMFVLILLFHGSERCDFSELKKNTLNQNLKFSQLTFQAFSFLCFSIESGLV